MSLELAIQANTAAIHQLIAVMSAGKFVPETRDEYAEGIANAIEDTRATWDRIDARKAEQRAQKNQQTTSEMQTVATIAQVVAQVVPVDEPKVEAGEAIFIEPAKPLTYEADVLPVLHRFLVAKGKPAAESLLKKYGVDKFSKVPAEQLGDLLADINKEMGAA